MTIEIFIDIRNEMDGGSLNLRHEFPTRSLDLGECADILKHFDELAKTIAAQNQPPIASEAQVYKAEVAR